MLHVALLMAATLAAAGSSYLIASSADSRKKLARLTATGISLGIGLMLLELPVWLGRVDYRLTFGIQVDSPWQNPENLNDRGLLHIHRPNSRSVGRMFGGNLASNLGVPPARWYAWDVTIDRNGFRNSRNRDAADVAVVGDSFVEGPLVEESALFTSVLERSLGVPVANLGQSHYGPQQELEVLRRFALPLEPRTCVWCFFEGNDLDDVQRYDLLTQDWDERVAAAHSPWQRSFTRNLLLLVGRSFRRTSDETEASRRSGILRLADGSEQRMYFSYGTGPLANEYVQALQEAAECLAEAARLCREHGAELRVVFMPTSFRVHQGICSFEPNSLFASAETSDLPRRLRSIVADLGDGVSFLDVTDALRARAAQGVATYFPDDTHMNADGHAVVAEALAGWLRR